MGQSMRRAGEASRAAFADAVRAAPEKRRLDFVWASAVNTNDGTPTRSTFDAGFGSTRHTRFAKDGDAVTVGAVIASLRGEEAHAALWSLAPRQQQAVFEAAANPRSVQLTMSGGMGMAGARTLRDADPAGFGKLVDAAASIEDPAARAAALSTSLAALRGVEGEVSPKARAEMAEAVLAHVDASTLASLAPDGVAALARALAARPDGPGRALDRVLDLPRSPHREALMRTMFLETPPSALAKIGALRAQFAKALAAGPADEPPEKAAGRADNLQAALATEGGRALLADPAVPGAARLWAAQEVMLGSDGAKRAMATDAPWEHGALAAAHAKGPLLQHAVRGSQATQV